MQEECKKCGAFCGTHANTDIPLGVPGNEEERLYRWITHRLFDSYWNTKGLDRGEAYGWLAGNIGLYTKDCHIGKFDVTLCKRAIKAIGISPDLETAEYKDMIRTNSFPWTNACLDDSITHERPSCQTGNNSNLPLDSEIQNKQIAHILEKTSIPDLMQYICNDIQAGHDLKKFMISLIVEYHTQQASLSRRPVLSIQDEITGLLK